MSDDNKTHNNSTPIRRGKNKIVVGSIFLVFGVIFLLFFIWMDINAAKKFQAMKLKDPEAFKKVDLSNSGNLYKQSYMYLYTLLPGFLILSFGIYQYLKDTKKANHKNDIQIEEADQSHMYLNYPVNQNKIISKISSPLDKSSYIFVGKNFLIPLITFILGIGAAVRLCILSTSFSGNKNQIGDEWSNLALLFYIISIIVFLNNDFYTYSYFFKHRKNKGVQFFNLDDNVLEYGILGRLKTVVSISDINKIKEYNRMTKLYFGPNIIRLNPNIFTIEEINKIKDIINKNKQTSKI
jgi:hypothetical protein